MFIYLGCSFARLPDLYIKVSAFSSSLCLMMTSMMVCLSSSVKWLKSGMGTSDPIFRSLSSLVPPRIYTKLKKKLF